jgi:hypothetical protein
MRYVHILNLIDDTLDRLTRARQLLLPLDGLLPTSAPKRAIQPAARKKTRPKAGSEKPATASLQIGPRQSKKKADSTSVEPVASMPPVIRLNKTHDPVIAPPLIQNQLFSQEQLEGPYQEAVVQKVSAAISVPTVGKAPTQRNRSNRNRAPVAVALSGSVSAAPVFIPAEQIRQERSKREAASGTNHEVGGPAGSTAAVPVAPLTAKLLTRRWLQGPVS